MNVTWPNDDKQPTPKRKPTSPTTTLNPKEYSMWKEIRKWKKGSFIGRFHCPPLNSESVDFLLVLKKGLLEWPNYLCVCLPFHSENSSRSKFGMKIDWQTSQVCPLNFSLARKEFRLERKCRFQFDLFAHSLFSFKFFIFQSEFSPITPILAFLLHFFSFVTHWNKIWWLVVVVGSIWAR